MRVEETGGRRKRRIKVITRMIRRDHEREREREAAFHLDADKRG